ncbi:copper amine oxidase N-terminal domain-containing protein [Clostridium sp. YIM B02555]|uniref:copper amine oxidase N-terminal domain-containing protein n=1 Tax=Clostridium sp. YIM B02555 TaxID=2911968 RepID=UPI001EEED61B|nr:copper amine oxidase N-terminal domain-containing protein [Clostridium sp. YIM B02555]
MKKAMISLLCVSTIIGGAIPVFAADNQLDSDTMHIMSDPILISTNEGMNKANDIIIEGKNIDLGKLSVVIKDGKVLVPLKVTAEALGFNVNIDKDNNVVLLDKDRINASITIGEDTYYYSNLIGKGKDVVCGKAIGTGASPIIIDNEVYVSIKVYNSLLRDEKAIGSFWCTTKDGQNIYVDNGNIVIGWKLINNKWYYMNNDGTTKKGWIKTNSNWYYVYDNGEMAVNTTTPDGYKVDKDGKWDFGKQIQKLAIDGIANPIEEFKTIEDAQKVLKFKILTPKTIPEKYNVKYISTISKQTFQICYSNGDNEILFRMGQGIENISGDYTEYKNNDIVKVNNKDIKLSGNDESVKLATWKVNEMSYSILVNKGMKKDDIINVIKSTF